MALNIIKNNLSKGSTEPARNLNSLRLYGYQFCPYVERVKLVLEAKGLKYDEVNIDLREKPEWYFTKNSLGKVPSLELTDGRILVESIPICDYLDEAFTGQRKVHPSDLFEKYTQRASLDSFMEMATINYRFITNQDSKTYLDSLEAKLQSLNDTLDKQKTKFIGSNDVPTMTDYLLWPWLERLPSLLKCALSDSNSSNNFMAKFPLVSKYLRDMAEDGAVKKVAFSEIFHDEHLKYYMDRFRKN